jgi:hypothetical protein
VTKRNKIEINQKVSSPEPVTDKLPHYIPPIISGIFTILAATSFAAVFTQPIIQIDVDTNDNIANIKITNDYGLGPATDMNIVVKSLDGITFMEGPRLFSTEPYNDLTNLTSEPTIMAINIPRFSNGPGSILQIQAELDLSINTNPNKMSIEDYYTTYVKYDQGSTNSLPSTRFYQHPLLLPIFFILLAIASFYDNIFLLSYSYNYIDYIKARHKIAPYSLRLLSRLFCEADRRIEKH